MKLVSAALATSVLAVIACSAQAPTSATPVTPSRIVAGLVGCVPPNGWDVEEYSNGGGADPVVAFVDGLDRIAVHVFGAPGSAFKTPADFLVGPAATTMGREPERLGSVSVAGHDVTLYRHGFPIHLGDPHVPAASVTLGREVFCVLPAADGRYVVLTYARESEAPDVDRRSEIAWDAFLRTVRLVGGKT